MKMRLRPLIIDDIVRARIGDVIAYAEHNVLSMDDLLDIHNKQGPAPGDMIGYVCFIPFGYNVVYSIEEQNPGKMRHLSISVDEDGKLPSPSAVEFIMQLFGFKKDLKECIVIKQDCSPTRECINVLELI